MATVFKVFNETVSMNLWGLDGDRLLMVHMTTHYCQRSRIKSKRGVITRKIMEKKRGIFGQHINYCQKQIRVSKERGKEINWKIYYTSESYFCRKPLEQWSLQIKWKKSFERYIGSVKQQED